ncbi:hypothetical protein WANG_1821 [Lactobacillus kefiranofaciens subsp. kefiranofaciens]|nr:hypothetical protein WANG_1821 [Lactobacillus kefiranofaciens subsp. kefiranofaciens]
MSKTNKQQLIIHESPLLSEKQAEKISLLFNFSLKNSCFASKV